MIARLMLYPFFALLLWFGAQAYSAIARRMIQLVAATISVALVGLHTEKYATLNRHLDEYYTCMSLVEPNTTLLALSFCHQGRSAERQPLSLRVRPFMHASGYICAQRHVVDLVNYEGSVDYFPVGYRAQLNPYSHIANMDDMESETPKVDFLTYPKRTGGRVDYVLLWGLDNQSSENANVQSVLWQLAEGYEWIFTSPQNGNARLYRRKDSQTPLGVETRCR